MREGLNIQHRYRPVRPRLKTAETLLHCYAEPELNDRFVHNAQRPGLRCLGNSQRFRHPGAGGTAGRRFRLTDLGAAGNALFRNDRRRRKNTCPLLPGDLVKHRSFDKNKFGGDAVAEGHVPANRFKII
ncbi:MAG: hypothetical protein BWY42_01182 [Candidatus Omnitrophica bacterium ADurb.Bin277]|nr:MAG: hypothetical protein BWY42_01182 [Candidatus Omnitrophica bacterium ADurb.Bin277]